MELILKYFPDLTERQKSQFAQLENLYKEWNNKINVISRKDIDNIYLHHVLHSLAIAKVIQFKKGSKVLDLGCGGGFPGIPLAIMFPDVQFTLIDGTRKKIKVVNEVAEAIGLTNAKGVHVRAEEHTKKYDFVITRAVALVEKLVIWTDKLIHDDHKNSIPNGIIALKGGNVVEEIGQTNNKVYSEVYPIKDIFDEKYYDEKFVIYIQH
ncbi:MAG: 16S rRNA (guanine(527)-N(7))-methyltransferase RsmG [Saprospiraceae bacterium]|nr:16S rRNA (guanine(527)-N(7))-methyltransferase RsmG [Saprospiraceae bacterium]